MEAGQQEKRITIHVIDDNQWEPDETFFVKLSLPDGARERRQIRFENHRAGDDYQ